MTSAVRLVSYNTLCPRTPMTRPRLPITLTLIVLVTLAIGAGDRAYAQALDWSADPSAYPNTMTVTGAVYVRGLRVSQEGDLVAAFSGETVRGVASPSAVGGDVAFFLTAYGDAAKDTLYLRYYDAARDRILAITEPLVFEPDGILGSPAMPIRWNAAPALEGDCTFRDGASWDVPTSRFSSTMTAVLEAAAPSAGIAPEDRLVAFAGGEVRGVAEPQDVGIATLFFLTIYGDMTGESIRLVYYEASSDLIYPMDHALAFAANAQQGTVSEPLAPLVSCTANATAVVRSGGTRVDVSVAPNPTAESAVIHIEHSGGALRVDVYDALGRARGTLYDQATPPGSLALPIEMHRLEAGTYFLHITSSASSSTRGVTVTR